MLLFVILTGIPFSMKQKFPALFFYFLAAIFLLNLLQAGFTELIFDEAYYWYYAQKLAWGYFDHPPMVALLIKIGSAFFSGELGIRFMSCLLGAGTFILLWLLIDDPRKKGYIPHFFVLLFSLTLVHAYGFLTLPDTPLLFFAALFFLLYKKFLNGPGYLNAFLLGLVMAALMYSKYHAFLVIFFVLLSNIKLIQNRFAWFSVFTALLFYSPHFFWLYQNDFVSIKYHLFERPNRPYEFMDFTLGFFINLVAVFGLTFPWVYKSLLKTKASDPFTRALLFVSYGILLFFFISSFQRRVQTQWIIIICIPMAVLAYRYMLQNDQARHWIVRMGLVNIGILLFLRIGLIYQPFFPIVYETHGNKTWVNKITSQVGDIPVIFENSYRMAPMFAFYSGNTSYSLNNVWYRENQYSIDASEELVRNQKVLYVSKYMNKGDIHFTMPDSTLLYGIYIDPFESFRKLRTRIDDDAIVPEATAIPFTVYNPYSFSIPLEKLSFGLVSLNAYKQVITVVPVNARPVHNGSEYLLPKENIQFMCTLPETGLPNAAYVKIAISENGLRWGLNGEKAKIK